MAEGTTAAAQPGTGSVTPSAPAAQPATGNGSQVDMAAYSALIQERDRYRDQVKGSQSFYETAKKHGFAKPEDFDSVAPLLETVRGRKLDAKTLANALRGEPDEAQESRPETPDFEALMEKKLTERERASAEKSHRRALESQFKKLASDDVLRDIFGEDADDELKAYARQVAESEWYANLKPYDEDHPLKGQAGPMDDIGPIHEKLRKFASRIKAAGLDSVGRAARKSAPQSTPAGSNGSSGPSAPSRNLSVRERADASIDEIAASGAWKGMLKG